ncbi:MAG: large conductance mechanosensitive channel protein MscL [Acidimicrobium sp.]|jgi:large conductance mechanosensitive channel|nr:large conductance mechanosensitive channel protein MscL [Actinomycetota bacterium]PHX72541.1 MAG: large conductance mechanosensitive channel protein MscL [Acidimicrobium sp.]
MSEIFTKVENLAKRGVIVEFKEFINRGNVIDLAVAFVMGAAFKTVVDSFAGSDKGPGILGGLIGAIFGGQQPDFSKKVLTVNGSDIPFGAFATSTLNFFFVALALFMVVKLYNRFRSKEDKEKASLNTNDLLVEIRDELRATRNNGKQ